ncbi:uncharacterized protein CXorf66 homolog [Eulemur rufifrons]|uniref:uncharacterized protein CXorf66 homolog n=1 Tax=Eulemur rufifrons TaxID=859984 RepID=UPI003742A2D6
MNLFICILLLSVWTYNCLNTNQSDVSTTTGAKPLKSMETKMDSFRRRLLIIVIGVMIIAFVSTCLCFLYFNCMSDDASKAGMVKKQGVAAKKSRSSKVSFSASKTASLCRPEKQPMLSTVDRLSRPLHAEKSSITSSAEKLIRPLSPEKSSISSSTEKLVSSSSPKKPSKPSGSKKLFRSYRKHSVKKSCKLSHAPKLVNPFNAGKPAILQYPASAPSKTPCPLYPQNQTLPPKPSRRQKLAKPPRHLKRSVNVGKAVLLSRPQLANTCQCYEERCLACKTFSEPLVNDISEAKKKQARNLPVSSKVKSFPGSFRKVDFRDNTYRGNMCNSDMMTYNSDDDSDREITIICNIAITLLGSFLRKLLCPAPSTVPGTKKIPSTGYENESKSQSGKGEAPASSRISRALLASPPSRCGTPRLGPAVSASSSTLWANPGRASGGATSPQYEAEEGDGWTTTPRLLREQCGGGGSGEPGRLAGSGGPAGCAEAPWPECGTERGAARLPRTEEGLRAKRRGAADELGPGRGRLWLPTETGE